MTGKILQLAALVRGFARARRGNVAMMFALSMLPLAIAAGVGLDFTRAMLVRQQMSEALDAAALAVGSSKSADLAAAQAVADKYFKMNYTIDSVYWGTATPKVESYDPQGTIKLSASANMPTILMKLVGMPSVPVSSTSTVVWGQTKLWVALVLDNSGSMCQPDGQPCVDNANTNSKIYQEKDAAKTMLTSLQGVSTTAGDVRVSIVPFNREVSVGTGNPSATYLDWTFWEAVPKANDTTKITDTYAIANQNKSSSSSPATIVFAAWGPGDDCPFTDYSSFNGGRNTVMSPFGFYCMPNSTNTVVSFNSDDTTTTARRIPSTGLICPSLDSGNYNKERNDRYYNGCWSSTKVTTGSLANRTVIVDQGSSSASCTGFSSTNCSCDSSHVCRTQKWIHTWVPNNHSTWGGCLTDRVPDLDISNGSVLASIPADNPRSSPTIPVSSTKCMPGIITPLEYDWTDLANKIDDMQAGGSTNQAIGVAHGWLTLTPGSPYGAPSIPANTTRYIILLSDGLNTQNRWWGDGSTEGTPDDDKIDARLSAVCTAAKADGIIIYTLYVHTNGGGSADPLQDCATDSSKYYDLTSSSQIATAFADITKQITNVRVSK